MCRGGWHNRLYNIVSQIFTLNQSRKFVKFVATPKSLPRT